MVKDNKQRQRRKESKLNQWYQQHRIPVFILSTPLVVFVIGFGMFSAYKLTVMREDTKDFNAAETQLRQLPLPEAESTEYSRSCSYRSSKDIIRANPICRVSRKDTYVDLTTRAEVLKKYVNVESIRFSTPLENFICGTGMLPYPSSDVIELVSSCGKRVKFQLYIEAD